MFVIGLLAGFVGGFLTGQRMVPSMPAQVVDRPRLAPPAEEAQPLEASTPVAVTEPAVVAPPAVVEPPVQSPAVVEKPEIPANRPATREAGAPGAAASRPRAEPRSVVENKPAMLELASRPLGATVYVDDVRVGVTPVTVNDVMPGTRRIRMEMFGHQTWTTSVDVQTGAHVRIGASLE